MLECKNLEFIIRKYAHYHIYFDIAVCLIIYDTSKHTSK